MDASGGSANSGSLQHDLKGNVFNAEDLLKFRRNTGKSLPDVGGLKGYAPSGSWLEEKQLDCCLRDRRDLFNEPRTAKPGDLIYSEWDETINRVVIQKPKGKVFQHMGTRVKNSIHLYPEEALFAMEMCALEVVYHDVPLSLQEAYALLLPERQALQRYQVYAHLARLGYTVVRHQGRLKITAYEKKIGLDKYYNKDSRSKLNRHVNLETDGSSVTQDNLEEDLCSDSMGKDNSHIDVDDNVENVTDVRSEIFENAIESLDSSVCTNMKPEITENKIESVDVKPEITENTIKSVDSLLSASECHDQKHDVSFAEDATKQLLKSNSLTKRWSKNSKCSTISSNVLSSWDLKAEIPNCGIEEEAEIPVVDEMNSEMEVLPLTSADAISFPNFAAKDLLVLSNIPENLLPPNVKLSRSIYVIKKDSFQHPNNSRPAVQNRRGGYGRFNTSNRRYDTNNGRNNTNYSSFYGRNYNNYNRNYNRNEYQGNWNRNWDNRSLNRQDHEHHPSFSPNNPHHSRDSNRYEDQHKNDIRAQPRCERMEVDSFPQSHSYNTQKYEPKINFFSPNLGEPFQNYPNPQQDVLRPPIFNHYSPPHNLFPQENVIQTRVQPHFSHYSPPHDLFPQPDRNRSFQQYQPQKPGYIVTYHTAKVDVPSSSQPRGNSFRRSKLELYELEEPGSSLQQPEQSVALQLNKLLEDIDTRWSQHNDDIHTVSEDIESVSAKMDQGGCLEVGPKEDTFKPLKSLPLQSNLKSKDVDERTTQPKDTFVLPLTGPFSAEDNKEHCIEEVEIGCDSPVDVKPERKYKNSRSRNDSNSPQKDDEVVLLRQYNPWLPTMNKSPKKVQHVVSTSCSTIKTPPKDDSVIEIDVSLRDKKYSKKHLQQEPSTKESSKCNQTKTQPKDGSFISLRDPSPELEIVSVQQNQQKQPTITISDNFEHRVRPCSRRSFSGDATSSKTRPDTFRDRRGRKIYPKDDTSLLEKDPFPQRGKVMNIVKEQRHKLPDSSKWVYPKKDLPEDAAFIKLNSPSHELVNLSETEVENQSEKPTETVPDGYIEVVSEFGRYYVPSSCDEHQEDNKEPGKIQPELPKMKAHDDSFIPLVCSPTEVKSESPSEDVPVITIDDSEDFHQTSSVTNSSYRQEKKTRWNTSRDATNYSSNTVERSDHRARRSSEWESSSNASSSRTQPATESRGRPNSSSSSATYSRTSSETSFKSTVRPNTRNVNSPKPKQYEDCTRVETSQNSPNSFPSDNRNHSSVSNDSIVQLRSPAPVVESPTTRTENPPWRQTRGFTARFPRKRARREEWRDGPEYPSAIVKVDIPVHSWSRYKHVLSSLEMMRRLGMGEEKTLYTGKVHPLVKNDESISVEQLMSRLQVIPQVNLTLTSEPSSFEMPQEKPLKFDYDVYLPNVKYRLSNPTLPDLRIVVVSVGDPVPGLSSIVQLQWPFKDGVPLYFAIAGDDVPAFYGINDVALPDLASVQS